MSAIPRVLQLHRARGDGGVETIDGVRVATAVRTLVDIIPDDSRSRELQIQAVHEAIRRGLIMRRLIEAVTTTPPQRSAESRLVTLAKRRRVVKASDVVALGVHTATLTRLVRSGVLERVSPGRCCLANPDGVTENHSLAVVAGAIPAGVVCLLTALQFHDVGTQLPRKVWLAVPRGTRVGALRNPPVRVVNIARALVDVGVERHKLEGQLVRVTSIARTVADFSGSGIRSGWMSRWKR